MKHISDMYLIAGFSVSIIVCFLILNFKGMSFMCEPMAHIFVYLLDTMHETYFMKCMLSEICMQQQMKQHNFT